MSSRETSALEARANGGMIQRIRHAGRAGALQLLYLIGNVLLDGLLRVLDFYPRRFTFLSGHARSFFSGREQFSELAARSLISLSLRGTFDL